MSSADTPVSSVAPVLCLVMPLLLLQVSSFPCVLRSNTDNPHQVDGFVCKDSAPASPPENFSYVINGYKVTFPTTHMFCGEIISVGAAAVGYRARSLAAPKSNKAENPAPFHEHLYGYPAYKNICIWDQNRKRCATKVLGDAYYNTLPQQDPHSSPPFSDIYGMFPMDWDVNNTVEVISRYTSACCREGATQYEGRSNSCEGIQRLCIINFSEYSHWQSTVFTIKVVFMSPITKKEINIETAFPAPNGIASCEGWHSCNAALLSV